jgi:hypothetical protein
MTNNEYVALFSGLALIWLTTAWVVTGVVHAI